MRVSGTVVFLGPSLALAEAARLLPARFRPPARQGDVLAALRAGARRIALLDGTFEAHPAVWHKEILAALSEGVAVHGAASMGALRAAELAAFGMAGHGRVFAAYREGRVQDDGEVALLHGPAELGFPALTLPLVTLRARIGAVWPGHPRDLPPEGETGAPMAAGPTGEGEAVFVRAAGIPYKERTPEALARALLPLGLAPGVIARLCRTGPDPKRADAARLLVALAGQPGGEEASPPRQPFRPTTLWAEAFGEGPPVQPAMAGCGTGSRST